MSNEKKRESDKPKKKDKKSELDRELNSTFPASDPPSHTQPGVEDDKDEKDKK